MIPDPPSLMTTPRLSTYSGPPADAAEAISRLEDGNRSFAKQLADVDPASGILQLQFEVGALGSIRYGGMAPKQQPFAAVLGCSDARVPTEMVLGQSSNNLFVVRVAGNVLGSECLGSLDYAVANMGSSIKLLVVLGHSNCGAVSAAVEAFLHPTKYLQVATTHALRAVVDRILVAVRTADRAMEHGHGADVRKQPGYQRAMIETSVAINAALTAATLKQQFASKIGPKLDVVYGVYNLSTGRVKLPLVEEANVAIRLAHPPTDEVSFDNLALLIATSEIVTGMLAGNVEA